MLTLTLPVRPMLYLVARYCSEHLACSDSLPCDEEMTARFYWDFR
jgi:hypothetical protein